MKHAGIMSGGNPAKFLSYMKWQEGEDPSETDQRTKRIMTLGGVGLAAAGAYLAYRGLDSAIDTFGSPVESLDVTPGTPVESLDVTPGTPNEDHNGSDVLDYDQDGGQEAGLDPSGEYIPEDPEKPWAGHNYFDNGYSLENSPFGSEHKTGLYNYGPPIDPEGDYNSAFLDFADSEKAIHANYIQAFKLEMAEGMTFEEIEDRLMNDEQFFRDSLEQLRDRMESSEDVIRTLESGTYGSTYGFEANGEMEHAYDDVIYEPGTVVEKRFVDENGIEHVVLLKFECGGQTIVEHQPHIGAPVEYHATPVKHSAPETVYNQTIDTPEQPIGGGEHPPVVDTPEVPPANPPVHETPGEPEVPHTPETPEVPEIPEEPEIPHVPEVPEEPSEPEVPIEPPLEVENKSDNPDDYMAPDAPLAEVNEPATPPAREAVTNEDVFDYEEPVNDIPVGNVGTETQGRVDFVDSGATQEEVAKLDYDTDHDAAVDQAVIGSKPPVEDGRGQETPLY